MENRIQLNGVWYVREDLVPETTTNTKEHFFDPDDVTNFEACVYETDDYCWEASRLRKNEDGSFYPSIDIKFTDKTPEDRKEVFDKAFKTLLNTVGNCTIEDLINYLNLSERTVRQRLSEFSDEYISSKGNIFRLKK